jgi:hypothetical protein
MGAPFQHTRAKLRRQAINIKGHLGNGYQHVRGRLEQLDGAIQTVKTVHSVLAPHINHTPQGFIFNENMKHLGKSYDAIRSKVVQGDHMVRTAVAVGGALHKQGMSIGL